MANNPYIGKLGPVIGNGLGGVPRRTSPLPPIVAALDGFAWAGKVTYKTMALDTTTDPVIDACRLSATHAIMCSGGSGAVVKAVVANVSGELPVFGGVYSSDIAGSTQGHVAAINSTSAVLVQRNSSGYLVARVLSVSDAEITHWTSTTLVSVNCVEISVMMLTETLGIATYQNNTTSNYLNAVAFSVSGTSISAVGSAVAVNSVISSETALARISNTDVICTYKNNTSGKIEAAVISTDDSRVVTFGSTSEIDALAAGYASVAIASNGRAVCVYRAAGAPYYVKAAVISFSGSVILGAIVYTSTATATTQMFFSDNSGQDLIISSFVSADSYASMLVSKINSDGIITFEEAQNMSVALTTIAKRVPLALISDSYGVVFRPKSDDAGVYAITFKIT